MRRVAVSCTLAVSLVVAAMLFLSGCSGKSSSSMSAGTAATVNVTVSDPATCSGPQGPFSHIFVTITDVQINASASAGDNDPGWIDLTPKLSQNPQQVDLLGQANDQCFLAMLGSSTELQPGSYQQNPHHLGEQRHFRAGQPVRRHCQLRGDEQQPEHTAAAAALRRVADRVEDSIRSDRGWAVCGRRRADRGLGY